MKTYKNNLGAILLMGLTFTSCLKDDDNNSQVIEIIPGTETVAYNDIQGFFEANEVQQQDFTIDAVAGGSITGENGTKITFYPNSFTDDNGDLITGDVDVSLKEIFSVSEMILSNKPTNAVGYLDEDTFLLSEGETEVLLSKDGNEVFLAPGFPYEISVPAAGDEDFEMLPFVGTATDEEGIVWESRGQDGTNSDLYYSEATAPAMYIYNTFDTGWSNCDKFYNYPGDKTTNFINLSDSPNVIETALFLIYKEDNLPAVVKFTTEYAGGLQSYEDMLPVGLEVTYIAITIYENQQYLAVQEATIAVDEELTLNFEPKTTQDILDALAIFN